MSPDPYRDFRPRMTRVVVTAIAVAIALGTVVLVVALPALYDRSVWADLVGIVLLGAGAVWFCWRQTSVRATPDREGLTVRNLIFSRRVAWAEIVGVGFGEGRPWVQLDLADGETLAVMGIQRADGGFARAEASRLAALVEAHSTPQEPTL